MEEQNQTTEQKIPEESVFQSVEGLEPIESEGLDLTPFEGKKVKIVKTEITEVSSQYSPTGKQKVLRVESEPVTTIKGDDGIEKPISASELFKLTEKDGKIGWSKDERAKLQKFLNKLKVTKPSELKDKEVTVRLRDNGFMGFIL